MAETALSSLHRLYTLKTRFICHALFGKSAIEYERQVLAHKATARKLMVRILHVFYFARSWAVAIMDSASAE